MTVHTFSKALGDINEKYLLEAIQYPGAKSSTEAKEIKASRKRPSAVALLAAAAAILLTVAAGATALTYWNDTLREYLGIPSAASDSLAEAIAMIGDSQTKDGITVTVEQAFGDTHTTYIVATAAFSENVPLDCKTTIIPTLKNVDGGYNFDCVAVDEETRTQTYIIYVHSSNKNLIGKKMGLEFRGFRGGRDYIQYSSETWSFSFQLDYKDLSRNVTLNKDVDDFHVNSVWLSPVSMILYIEDLPAERRVIEDFDIIMKDGTLPDIKKYQIIGGVPRGNTTPIFGMFPQVIDPENVKSVVVNGIEIPID